MLVTNLALGLGFLVSAQDTASAAFARLARWENTAALQRGVLLAAVLLCSLPLTSPGRTSQGAGRSHRTSQSFREQRAP